ncbi:MAG: DUF2817 domain-containing protein [Ilumatobacteraceae bacterium]
MQMRRAPAAALAILVASVLAACSDGSSADAPEAAEPAVPISVTTTEPSAASSAPSATTAGSSVDEPSETEPAGSTGETGTTSPTTGSPDTTTPPTVVDEQFIETRLLGRSVEGRPIMAERRGTEGGRVVLVIGVIHGNEDAGLAILDDLHRMEVPDDVDLWLVDSMNPDGVVNQDRHNANGVDLNRNFPLNWGPIGVKGDGEWSGPGPASEPETQAMMELISDIRPDITLWYHQDLYRIQPGRGRDGRIRARYAELTGLPIAGITGGTYTGVAATWARHEIDPGVAFIVELGAELTDAEAEMHAEAVLTIADEDL